MQGHIISCTKLTGRLYMLPLGLPRPACQSRFSLAALGHRHGFSIRQLRRRLYDDKVEYTIKDRLPNAATL